MNDVQKALTRKLGPLPAYAWAGIGGVALWLYRRRSGASSNVPAALSPDVTDQTAGLRDPITLDPGQSVYDPGTGGIVTAPGGGDGGGAGGDPSGPPTTEPPPAGGGGTGKRKPKPKPKHAKPAKSPAPGILRKRLKGAVGKTRVAKPAKGHPAAKPNKPHAPAKPAAHKPAAPGRSRAKSPSAVALRQRPAAPKVVNHATQQVAPHPAAPPKAAAKAPIAPPKPKPAPPHVAPPVKRKR